MLRWLSVGPALGLSLGLWLPFRIHLHGLIAAVILQVLLMWWALYVLWAVPLPLVAPWFRVRPWEVAFYRGLGVYSYMRLLKAVGWQKLRSQAQGFDGTRASLHAYERHTREAEFSHTLLLACHGPLLLWLAADRTQLDTAAWLLVTGVFCHLYPVMLQRTLRARLGPLSRRLP